MHEEKVHTNEYANSRIKTTGKRHIIVSRSVERGTSHVMGCTMLWFYHQIFNGGMLMEVCGGGNMAERSGIGVARVYPASYLAAVARSYMMQ
jgi:hypothetical protein